MNDDWTIADYLRRADGGAEILFEAEEIESTAEEMLGPVWTYRQIFLVFTNLFRSI